MTLFCQAQEESQRW